MRAGATVWPFEPPHVGRVLDVGEVYILSEMRAATLYAGN